MGRLDEFARTSPFSKATFISAQQQLLAFGIEARKVVPYLDAIQNAVAAAGGSNADIAGLVATMSKIQSTAKLTAQDLNEFGNRGVNAAELIGSQMGMTGAEIRESITAGSLDAMKALDALVAGMNERFDGAADNVKNTFAGALDRVGAAWRDLSSSLAEPFVGKEGGGIFTGLLNELADAMRALEELPGPVRAAAGALGGLVAVGGTLGGAFILLAPKIAAARTQLALMPPVAQKAAGALGGLSKGLAAVTAGYIAYQGAAAAFSGDEATAAASEYAIALGRVARGQTDIRSGMDSLVSGRGGFSVFNLGRAEVDGLTAALEALSKSGFTKFTDAAYANFGLAKTEADIAAEAISKLDAELANLATGGNAEGAARVHAELAAEAAKVGLSLSDLNGYLPLYTDATGRSAAAQEEAAGSTKTLSEQLSELSNAYSELANQIMTQREAEIGYLDTLDSVREAVTEGTRVQRDKSGAVNDTAKATREADAALINLAKAAGRVTEGMIEAGAPTDELAAAAARQREQFIATAEAMGYTAQEAVELAESYGLIPSEKITKLEVNDRATATAAKVKRLIEAIPKSWRSIITTERRTVYADDRGNAARGAGGRGGARGAKVPAGFVSGGVVPGTPPPQQWIDNMLGIGATGAVFGLRSGEWIINEPQSKKNDKTLRAINEGLNLDKYLFGYASGGRVDVDRTMAMSAARPTIVVQAATAAGSALTATDVLNLVDSRLAGIGVDVQVGVDNRTAARIVQKGSTSAARLG